MYTPADGQYDQLLTRIWAGEGQSGYVKAQYDDVFTDSTIIVPTSIMLLNGD